MKFNWGTGITIAIVAFMAFIISMVIKMTSTDNDLYAKDYYIQEIAFQDRIDARNNTQNLKSAFQINQTLEAIEISFPDDLSSSQVAGTVQLYRPDDAQQDKTYNISLFQGRHIILLEEVIRGKYILKVHCTADDIPYFYESVIQI